MLSDEDNEDCLTENMDKSYKSSGSYLVDFFGLAGAVRSRTEKDILSMFYRAFSEDKLKAVKLLFYFRDVRGGQGERRTFRIITKDLANNYPEIMRKNLILFSEYGRWDDLISLMDTPLKTDIVSIIRKQLDIDLSHDKISLLAKWLPSENTSSKTTTTLATQIREALSWKPKVYRKTLTTLRAKIKIVEADMSAKKWGSIEYPRVPSKAAMTYRKAFSKHDADRYTAYIKAVQEGKEKINAGTLYPYEIYEKAKNEHNATVEALWTALPDYTRGENALVMADVSGSMEGRPMAVSVSLAIYFAEHNKGAFGGYYMTFSEAPKLMKVPINCSLHTKIQHLESTDVGYNTDLNKALMMILTTAVKNKVLQEDLPKRLYVISDMQFDEGSIQGKDESTFKRAEKEFKASGYTMPQVVFWQVDARHTQVPALKFDNVILCSGASPVLFKQLMENKSVEEVMNDIINSKRYEAIKI
jgi:hypothetical protein